MERLVFNTVEHKLEELDKDSHIKFKQKFSAKDIKIKLLKEKK